MTGPTIRYELVSHDRTGREVGRSEGLSESLVEQFLQLLHAQMFQTDYSMLDTDGNTSAVSPDAENFRCDAAVGDYNFGMQVGTSAQAVDIADNKLISPIINGTGTGALLYGAQLKDSSVTTSDPDASFAMWRNFTNNSGATITVREMGLYVAADRTTWATKDVLIVRDVPTALAVPDGGGCYAKYTWTISE